MAQKVQTWGFEPRAAVTRLAKKFDQFAITPYRCLPHPSPLQYIGTYMTHISYADTVDLDLDTKKNEAKVTWFC